MSKQESRKNGNGHRKALRSLGLITIAAGLARPATAAALDLDPQKLLCKVFDHIDDIISAGSPKPDVNTMCSIGASENLHYLGGFPSNRGLQSFVSKPYISQNQFYCAVAESGGAKATGTVSAGSFGTFGMDTEVRITSKDPSISARRIDGQRVGTLRLFGASIPIDVQNFSFMFPGESRAAGTVRASDPFSGTDVNANVDARTGFYMNVAAQTLQWKLGGHMHFRVDPFEVDIDPLLEKSNAYDQLGNGWLPANAQAGRDEFKYDAYRTARANCLHPASGLIVPDLAACGEDVTSQQFFEHYRYLPAGGFSNLQDGMLPADMWNGGALPFNRAASANAILYKDYRANWFHFGYPFFGIPAPNEPWAPALDSSVEPVFDLAKDVEHHTLHFSLPISISLVAGPLTISMKPTTQVWLKSGFGISRQKLLLSQTTSSERLPTEDKYDDMVLTVVDAQSSAEAHMDVSIKLDLGLFSTDPISFAVPILKQTTTPAVAIPGDNGSVGAALIRQPFDTSDTSRFTYYSVGSSARSDPEAARNACLQSTGNVTTPVVPNSINSFLHDVTSNVLKAYHPCSARLCARTASGSMGSTCSMVAGKFTCTTPAPANCDRCGNVVQFCDANERVVETRSDPGLQDCPRVH